VALTGFAAPADRARAVAAGFHAHLAKPVEPDALVAVLHSLLRRPREPGAADV
jgi:CheY-like chemotaxis protein